MLNHSDITALNVSFQREQSLVEGEWLGYDDLLVKATYQYQDETVDIYEVWNGKDEFGKLFYVYDCRPERQQQTLWFVERTSGRSARYLFPTKQMGDIRFLPIVPFSKFIAEPKWPVQK